MREWATAVLRWCGILLYATGLHRVLIWLHRHDPKVLAFHACESAEDLAIQGLAVNTTPVQFAAILAFLRRHYNVVPLEAMEKGDYPERAVAITFDDGYRGVYENAFPLLRSFGFPATIFVVTSAVGNGAMVWVNELNWLLRAHPGTALPRAARAVCSRDHASPEAIVDCAARAFDWSRVRSLLAELRAAAGVDAGTLARELRLFVSWEELEEMARHGVRVGNHTANHPNLTELDEAAQREDMAAGQRALRGRPGTTTSLAYPFGLYNDASERAAAALGCSSMVTVGGVNRPLNAHRIARVPVVAGGAAALFSQMEVLEPIRAVVRRWVSRGMAFSEAGS